MPAVFQCPALAAKCDCEARGHGGPGQRWVGETPGLEGEKLRADGKEGMRSGKPFWSLYGATKPTGIWGSRVGTVGAGEEV